MKTNEFYHVLVPLINSILTGNQQLHFVTDKISLTTAFIPSLPPQKTGQINAYFLECIETYIPTLSYEERLLLTKVFLENRKLLSVAILIRDLDRTPKPSKVEYNQELIQILLDFISQKKIGFSLTLTLHFYLENLQYIAIENDCISLETYFKMLNFHSRRRNKEEIME